MTVENSIGLPSCCPVSGNPQMGSKLRIRYRPTDWVLEVYSLAAAIKAYVGGHPSGIRNMESLVQHMAVQVTELLEVPVVLIADLVLHPHQEMRLVVRATPKQPPL